jgi:hypothetical protein
MVLGMVSSPATFALCESSNDDNTPGILDTLFPKDEDGKVYWDKASKQVTEAVFWDKLAKATGQKVRLMIWCDWRTVTPLTTRTLTDLPNVFCRFKALLTLAFPQPSLTVSYQVTALVWR